MEKQREVSQHRVRKESNFGAAGKRSMSCHPLLFLALLLLLEPLAEAKGGGRGGGGFRSRGTGTRGGKGGRGGIKGQFFAYYGDNFGECTCSMPSESL